MKYFNPGISSYFLPSALIFFTSLSEPVKHNNVAFGTFISVKFKFFQFLQQFALRKLYRNLYFKMFVNVLFLSINC